MGEINPPRPVKLIVGMIAASGDLFEVAQEELCNRYGEIDFESEVVSFDQTQYYEHQMGLDLKRKFISFAELIDSGALANIKLFTNELEARISEGYCTNGVPRPVNLDPGYVTMAKLVLASTKDHAHRIYLRDGVYAEVTLQYRKGKFRPWSWTYPDYKTERYRAVFRQIRDIYLGQLSHLIAHKNAQNQS